MNPDALMRRAIALSLEKMQQGSGGPFGAVIARDGEVVAEGWNQVTSANDPTAHAEVVAIRRACTALGRFDLSDCEIYTSCEPCPMCLGAIYWSRVKAFYYAASKEDAARGQFDDSFIYSELNKPVEGRSIPGYRLLEADGFRPFDEWLKNQNRIRY